MIGSSSLLEINTNNLVHNYLYLKKLTVNNSAGATIKANAYGLGYTKVYKILSKVGCKDFFVATLEEALKIRKINQKNNLYVLNGIQKNETSIVYSKKIVPILNSFEEAHEINNKFIKKNKKIKVGLHIDTGINRLGLNENIDKLKTLKKLNVVILLSHLSSADEIKNKYNLYQNKIFINHIKKIQKIKKISLANSLGIMHGKEFHYDLVRPGIAIYGGHYNNRLLKKNIKPVVTLKARILQIKNITKNEFIGYNQTYKAKKNLTIAILGIGYADGISRKLSNKGNVYYKNYKFNIIGRVSMDSITIDISSKKNQIKRGQYMEIINKNNDIEKFAKNCNTISNEILTSISSRVKRTYI